MSMKSTAKKIMPRKAWAFLASSYRKTKTLPFYMFRVFPIQKNKIVISSYFGKGFGDNGKYIALELLKQDETYDIVWLVKDLNAGTFPERIRSVKINSLRGVYEQVTARIWIDNCRKPSWIRKRSGQYYVQTWHGSLGAKKCEKDAGKELGFEYIKMAMNDSNMIDLCISNGKHISNIYKNSFWYDGAVLECGMPRNDVLLSIKDEQKNRIKEWLNINGNICLYAPTFRNDYNTRYYDLNYGNLKESLESKFGGEFSIIVRLHPNFSSYNTDWKLPMDIINVTDYPDMQELLAVSDVVITDYSSCIYDFAFTNRPAFIFATDLDDYRKTNRDLYFNLEDTPFKLAQTNDELIKNIKAYSENEYRQELKRFFSFHGVFENGNASKKVAEQISLVINEENKK